MERRNVAGESTVSTGRSRYTGYRRYVVYATESVTRNAHRSCTKRRTLGGFQIAMSGKT